MGKHRLWISSEIKKKLKYKGEILYASHHDSHAAAAYFSSPFADAAILTLDGVGEFATTTISTGLGNKIDLIAAQNFPHSLGLLYSAFTQYCGFKVNSGEYKLMGLAPYGKPLYKQNIYDHLITQFDDGSYILNMKYFSYSEGNRMINKKFEKLFGMPRRKEESGLSEFYKDIAASIQEVIEEIVLNLVKQARLLTNKTSIVFSGGVVLNCKLNQKIVEANIFDDHYFYPNPGDAGSAVGAAYLAWFGYLENTYDAQNNSSSIYLGNIMDAKECLSQLQVPFQILDNASGEVAKLLSEGKIIGWYNGKIEFGPRALGNRSILADPRNPNMKNVLNEKIKLRENFRPFAPAILEEEASGYFEMHHANYDTMMVTAKVKPGTKELMPAVVHEDGTARIQVVTKGSNKEFHDLLKSFHQLTGCPALINTSFNIRGEPIVESVEDALRTFIYTDMDLLIFNNSYLVSKEFDLEFLKKKLPQIKYAND
jgi:carbamoyltransferase